MAKKKDTEKKSTTQPEVKQVDDVWSLGNMDKKTTDTKRTEKSAKSTKSRSAKSAPMSKQTKTKATKSASVKKETKQKATKRTSATKAKASEKPKKTKRNQKPSVQIETEVVNEEPSQQTSSEYPITPSTPIRTVPFVDEPEVQFAGLEQVLSDLPQDVIDNMPTIQNRINAYLTYFSAMRLGSLPRLFRFIDAAEQIMFNPDDLLHLDFDQINNAYRNAKATANDTLEQARKVTQTVQVDNDKKVDTLYNMLTAMSPDTVARMLEMASDAEREKKEQELEQQNKLQHGTKPE